MKKKKKKNAIGIVRRFPTSRFVVYNMYIEERKLVTEISREKSNFGVIFYEMYKCNMVRMKRITECGIKRRKTIVGVVQFGLFFFSFKFSLFAVPSYIDIVYIVKSSRQ